MSAPLLKNKPGSRPRFARLPLRSLTWQLIFITILPVTVLVMVVAFGSLAVHQNAMRTLVGERDERFVHAAAAALEEQVNHRMIAVRQLSTQLDQADSHQIDSILASSDYLLQEFDAGLAVFNADGSLVGVLGEADVWASLAAQMSPELVRMRESVSPTYLSSPLKHPLTGETLFVIIVSSPDGNWITAGAFLAAEMVRHTLTSVFTSSTEASIAVVDPNGRLLYGSGSFTHPGEVIDHPGIDEALQGESGTTYVQVQGSEHVVAYSPIAPMEWGLILEEPWEMVASPTLQASQLAPLVLVPVLLLALVAFWFGARQIVRPLQMLEAKAATLAGGDFKSIETPVGGIEEIRQLQAELILMAHKVQASQKSLHTYIGAITTAQEEERRRLARELHDDTIQALIALKQRAQLAQLDQDSRHRSEGESVALQEIASLIEQTIENLRRLTSALRPIYLEDLGLVTALEMLARETGQVMDIPVEFQKEGIEVRLDPSVELALYRIVQEAFSNIARHARAKRASLYIKFSAQTITIEIADDGVGFNVPKGRDEFAPNGHFGLLGLHERAELIGALLVIHSMPGKGTQVSIHLPLLSL